MVRTVSHTNYNFGLCPSGTNAVVAVISYTGSIRVPTIEDSHTDASTSLILGI
jgi:hypothetical protein